MSTRRDRLIPRDKLTGKPVENRLTVVSLRDLKDVKVRVPPELFDSGMSLIVTVANDGRLIPGLVNDEDVPATKPIEDLNKVLRARQLVSSVEATNSKATTIEDVKSRVMNLTLDRKIPASAISLRPGAQAEFIRCKGLAKAALQNQKWFVASNANRDSYSHRFVGKWFEDSTAAIDDYIASLCQPGEKKLSDFVFELGIPMWFFNRVTTAKVPEFETASCDEVLFPKKLSKMIAFTFKEASSFLTRHGSEQTELFLLLEPITRMMDVYPKADETALFYPIPPNYRDRLTNFSDLPAVDRSAKPLEVLSVTVLHMLFCAFPPKVSGLTEPYEDHMRSWKIVDPPPFTESTYRAYSDSFISSEERPLKVKSPEDFAYDKSAEDSLKTQYKRWLSNQPTLDYFQPERMGEYFLLSSREKEFFHDWRFILPKINREPKDLKTFGFSGIFSELFQCRPAHAISAELRERFKLIRPQSPKELNFGPASIALSPTAKKLISALERADADKIFLKNVKAFLQSFHSAVFQEQAVKIMIASLEAKEVLTLNGEEGEEEDRAEELDFGKL